VSTSREEGTLHTEETAPLALRLWVERAATDAEESARLLRQEADVRVGEGIRFGFSASRDAYLYLFDLDPVGAVAQLVPSTYYPDNHVRERLRYIVPPDAGQAFPVTGPTGVETFFAVATTELLPTLGSRQLTQESGDATLDFTDVAQMLSGLPRDQWAVRFYQFRIQEQ
jgi:hypothetical protein